MRTSLLALTLVTLPSPAESVVLELRGALDWIEEDGIDLSVEPGDEVVITISYDETQMEDEASLDDPTRGFFPDSVRTGRTQIPAEGIDFGFASGSTTLDDDVGSSPVLTDFVTWILDEGGGGSPTSAGPALAGTVSISDIRSMPPAPDLVENPNVLPNANLDLDSPGTLTVIFDVAFESRALFLAQLTDPVAIAVPEPGAGASNAAVVATLAVFAARRRKA